MGDGRAEQGDDLVADDLVEAATERRDVDDEPLEAPVDERASPARVGGLGEVGEADEVGHQHGDEPAFLGCDDEPLPALGAEPRTFGYRRPACRAGHLRRLPAVLDRPPSLPTGLGVQVGRCSADIPSGRARERDMEQRAMQRQRNIDGDRGGSRPDARDEATLRNTMRDAIDRGEFRVYYQPIVGFARAEVIGIEALLRWEHPQFGVLTPAQFLHLAEDTGLIVPIGTAVLARRVPPGRAVGPRSDRRPAPLAVSVNLSARQVVAARSATAR